MKYFGTSTREAGHYLWDVTADRLINPSIYIQTYPFKLEHLTDHAKRNGDCFFYQIDGYSILAIEGSCSDDRPGSHSVFFLKELITVGQLIEKIMAIPIAKSIIKAMPFEVRLNPNPCPSPATP